MRQPLKIQLILVFTTIFLCSCSLLDNKIRGSASSASPAEGRFEIAYPENNPIYEKDRSIAVNSPTLISGDLPVTFSVSPSLPDGLHLDTSTGAISGVPTVLSTGSTYLILARNETYEQSISISIIINDTPPSGLNYLSSTLVYSMGSAITDNTLTASGGAVVSYSVSPLLPAGLTLDTITGVISGTPSVLDSGTIYRIEATNSGGTVTTEINITINDAAPTGLSYTTSSPTYSKYLAITNNTLTVSGGAVISFAVSPALPTGLNLNVTTGIISGTPTSFASGSVYTVTATNSGGSTTDSLFITVIGSSFTWIGNGGDTNWSNGGNWSGGGVPGSTATAIFDVDCGSFCNATIDLSIDIQEINLKSTFTGTITQASGATITLGSNQFASRGGWIQEGGAFIGDASDIRMDYFTLNDGSFQSTSTELRIGYHASSNNVPDGITFSSTGIFTPNGGTVFIDVEGSNGPPRRSFRMELNSAMNFYNLEIDLKSHTQVPLDNSYNGHYLYLTGSSARINVTNNLRFRDGSTLGGEIYFYGSNVQFDCDTNTSSDICSDVIYDLNREAAGFTGITSLVYAGASAQTYTFADGAGTPGFRIENTNGVTSASVGKIRIPLLYVKTGSFAAPSGTLSLGGGTTTSYFNANSEGVRVDAGASFIHNNGLFSIDYATDYSSNRTAMSFIIDSGSLNFYDLILNINGNWDGTSVDGYEVKIPSATTLIIDNSLIVANGRFTSIFNSSATIDIKGSYQRTCTDSVNNICAGLDESIKYRFSTGASTVTIDPLVANFNSSIKVEIDVGVAQTLSLQSDFQLNAGSSELAVLSGTLDLAAGVQVILGDDLINNSIITCGAGAYITVAGFTTGTPLGGDNNSCYDP